MGKMNTNISPINNAKYNHVPLSARLENLVGNKYRSDFTFIIEDDNVEIPAHKLIVALASPVLERIMYGNETFRAADSIKVDAISKESFMQILHYIYTDRIHINDDNVFEILHKSNYFGLPGIEIKCLEHLEESLDASTVPWIYHQLFYVFPTCKLLRKCLQYIRIQPLQFFASEYFEKISVDELKSILQMDAINCTEVDLFEAVIKLSRAHCAAIGLEPTGPNQRKVLDGVEKFLRLQSLSEVEFDKCLEIQSDFYSSTEIERIRADIRNHVPTIIKRKRHTYEDAVWTIIPDGGEIPPNIFYSGNHDFIRRYFNEDMGQQVYRFDHKFAFGLSIGNLEVLCGSGYEWRECVGGEIPIGAVSIYPKGSDPVFIAREHGNMRQIGPAYMNGKMAYWTDSHSFHERTEFEILVASNVKSPYNGNGAPEDAILIGYDDNNFKTYLGRAWFRNDLLPAKLILQLGAFVPYGTVEEKVAEFDFVRMDTGTYEWKESRDGEVPTNAVVGGVTTDGEDLFFGRVLHGGNYIPGKIHQSHGVLYVPYRGQELNFRIYEVLVHVKSDSEMSTALDLSYGHKM
ncbi:uncharacterized protein LOC119074858 [Bradysia coprophila]|uniref:uncharacterized protein LOC119074858 n=1 Tax=Bradysia coprophila TaxID=38358 RepID=UPI00187D9746|nr:uncharacterized protein LOC119074858 [Bradysia coprophila]